MVNVWLVVLTILVAGSVRETDASPTLTPRTGVGMVYDSLNDRVVVYGGYLVYNPFEFLGGTWAYSFSENMWTRIDTAVDPGPRGAPAMAYSPDHEMILLFGGMNTRGRLDDTWAFDCEAETWVKLEPSHRPEGRGDSAMVYDAASKRFILYGGWGQRSGLLSDTWVYDPVEGDWAEVETEASPGRMYGHSMAWDPVPGRAILYGGHLDSPVSHDYVENPWFFYPENGTWVEHVLDSGPRGRYWGSMGYDSELMRLVYFGGGWGEGPCNETLVLDLRGGVWSRLETEDSPSSRVIPRMVFVPGNGFLLFGGATPSLEHFNDTWVLSPDVKAWVELHPAAEDRDVSPPSDAQGVPGFPFASVLAGVALLLAVRRLCACGSAGWWAGPDLNRRLPRCERGVLPC